MERFEAIIDPLLRTPTLRAALLTRLRPPGAADDAGAAGEHRKPVVLLVPSPALAGLPLEGLSALTDAFGRVNFVGRELSMYMLHHRLTSLGMAGDEGRDAAAPPMPDGNTNFVVDPRFEDRPPEGSEAGGEAAGGKAATGEAATSTYVSVVESVKKGWTAGVAGSDRTPSNGEWQRLMTATQPGGEGGAFVFCGPGRLLAHTRPGDLAGLDASGCPAAIIVDRADNENSYRRLSKLDTQKKGPLLSLEDPFETSVLLSLAGINCVLTNQWDTSPCANRRFLQELFGSLRSGKDVGQSVHLTMRKHASASSPPSSSSSSPSQGGGDGAGEGDGGGGGGGAAAEEEPPKDLKRRVWMNAVVYGVPHLKLQ